MQSRKPTQARRVAVIGAGWAGLAAALKHARGGAQVTVFERSSSPTGAGGRASVAYAAGTKAPFAIDNGQHVMVGAYGETFALMRSVGVDEAGVMLRIPASWHALSNHTATEPTAIPALDIAVPAWCERSKALWRGPLKMLPITLALLGSAAPSAWPALLLASIRLLVLRPAIDETVLSWLARLKFPTPYAAQLWLPLCYATLNTPPDIASATVFKRVISDSLLAGLDAAAMWVPKTDLNALLPASATRELQALGANFEYGVSVQSIEDTAKGARVAWLAAGDANAELKIQTTVFDQVICATSAKDAVRLLPSHLHSPALRYMAAQPSQPISTLHLYYPSRAALPRTVCILPEPCDAANPISHAVLIDRRALNAQHAGWVTMVLSCSKPALALPKVDLLSAAAQRLHALLPHLGDCDLAKSVAIHAKQATFTCCAGLARPEATLLASAVSLAGDYVAGPYPSTLEGAIMSGNRA